MSKLAFRLKCFIALALLVWIIALLQVYSKNLMRNARNSPTANQIPHRIHQTYKNLTIPKIYSDYMRSWFRDYPTWEHWFWTDEDIQKLIQDYYPEFDDLYKSYKFGLERSDLGRYLILQKFGGLFVDLDYESFKPIGSILKGKTCLLIPEPWEQSLVLYRKDPMVTNAMMWITPDHQLLDVLLKEMLRNRPEAVSIYQSIYSTGPVRLQCVAEEFVKNFTNSTNPKRRVSIAKDRLFLASTDAAQKGNFKAQCAQIFMHQAKIHRRLLRACANFHAHDYVISGLSSRDTYSDHHWLHLGYKNLRDVTHKELSEIVDQSKIIRYSLLER